MEKISVSLLRIYAPLGEAPLRCQWVHIGANVGALIGTRQSNRGEGPLAELPRHAQRVQLVIPAAQVLITRAHLPPAARRRAGSVLAFAVEDATAAEPDANQVSWLGAVPGNKAGEKSADALAVVEKEGLKRWRDALEGIGLRVHEVHAETLLLPRAGGEWSLAWDGAEGFMRTGEFEGAATDGGDRASPPLSLCMMLEEAQLRDARPEAIAVYVSAPGASPDLQLWEAALGVPTRLAGAWDWRTAPEQAGVSLAQERRRWRIAPELPGRLRPAAWIAATALAIHAVSLIADWSLLRGEQRSLRGQMETRFRDVFPDAVAVADPGLQMRRQLAVARHRAGLPDGGDFAPMIEKVAIALKELPAGALRAVSYEGGRMTLELAAIEETALRRTVARLIQSGLAVDVAGTKLITVRAL
jgi:general secretion pathway protein L